MNKATAAILAMCSMGTGFMPTVERGELNTVDSKSRTLLWQVSNGTLLYWTGKKWSESSTDGKLYAAKGKAKSTGERISKQEPGLMVQVIVLNSEAAKMWKEGKLELFRLGDKWDVREVEGKDDVQLSDQTEENRGAPGLRLLDGHGVDPDADQGQALPEGR